MGFLNIPHSMAYLGMLKDQLDLKIFNWQWYQISLLFFRAGYIDKCYKLSLREMNKGGVIFRTIVI